MTKELSRISTLASRHTALGSGLEDWNGMGTAWSYDTDPNDEHVAVRETAGMFDMSPLKKVMVRGADETTAVFGSSLIWLGLAAGSLVVPWWSDKLRQRKLPIILGSFVQLVCLVLLIYVADLGNTGDLTLFFIFGFANSSHMLAFSTVADTVEPHKIGTSAAIVNGIMFIFGGLLIARPGIRIDRALELGFEPGSMDLAQYAALPLVAAISLGLILALAIRETYPDNY